ncbi:hypothetical protein J18TS1_30780 [Oceanobacillus oncorhynchi subsp. incaldanensis]|nr:hypothetical protein J18TS1_30780 [Oceanobacillus oncorhynchi subsp. incaldanensis]
MAGVEITIIPTIAANVLRTAAKENVPAVAAETVIGSSKN